MWDIDLFGKVSRVSIVDVWEFVRHLMLTHAPRDMQSPDTLTSQSNNSITQCTCKWLNTCTTQILT